uniref:restriction endonuclease subunit S n=1 Tax=Herbidospora sakaeratensis TaxID=564415 RepID=UPI000A543B24|nr:restriction endonuclease subunit S [Herbidospora sakaeratensis]
MRDLPHGWLRVFLKEVTEERMEKVGARKSITVLSSTKHHGLVPSVEYFKGRTIYSDDLANYKIVRRGWFAYATNHLAEGSIGLQEKLEEACVSPIYTVFSTGVGVDPSFMFRALKSPRLLASYAVHEQASVDRRGAIRYKDFGKIEIDLPSECEQRRIADILNTLDRRVTSIDLSLDKFTLIHVGLIDYLLSSVVAGETPLRVHLAQSPKNGYSPKEVEGWTGLLALGLGCLTSGGFQARQLKNVPMRDGRNRSALLSDGDLLMSRANTRDLVGLAGIYSGVGVPCIYPDLIMKLSPGGTCRAEYLELQLRSHGLRRQIQAIAQGTSESMVKISGSSVQDLMVRIPSLEEQDRVLGVAHASKAAIRRLEEERNRLQLLKRGLMEDLLTGRVRVAQAEAILESL